MNVLLVQPRLPYSFWSFDQVLKLTGRKALVPPLGLVTVAALVPQEWNLQLVDRNFEQISEEMWNWSETVMISGMIVQADDMLQVTKEARRRGKIVVVGGPYPTLLPDELTEAGAHFVVKGEAETALPVFLEALISGQKGGVIEEPSKPSMGISPMPRFDLLRLDAYVAIGVQTSRGCPHDCEFCNVTSMYGKKPRYKGADQVITELELLYSLGGHGEVFLCDDNFIGSRKHARSILEKLILWNKAHGEPFSFWTQVSADLGHDLELIDLMTKANFNTVFIGIESADEEVLELTGKYQNIRNPLAESIHNINANGLTIVGSFVIGLDGEKEGNGDRMFSLIEQTNIPVVMLNTLQPLPGTALWCRLKEENRLLDERGHGVPTGGELGFVPTRPMDEIVREYRNLTDRLYEPSAFLRRAYQFYMNMRPTRKALGAETEAERSQGSLAKTIAERETLRHLRCLLFLLWRQGIAGSARIQFWKQLIRIGWSNPSRLFQYLITIFNGEDLLQLRNHEGSKSASFSRTQE
ncbi:MAG: B12-binding domain-containing radical SAM protein [Desulfomonilaceae bacterium]